jgi:hypothetical protein
MALWREHRLGRRRPRDPEGDRACLDASPGHRHNILDRDFRELGAGLVRGTPSSPKADGAIYATDFGLRVK